MKRAEDPMFAAMASFDFFQEGASRRDIFSAMMLQGILSNSEGHWEDIDDAAQKAVQTTDALFSALGYNKSEEPKRNGLYYFADDAEVDAYKLEQNYYYVDQYGNLSPIEPERFAVEIISMLKSMPLSERLKVLSKFCEECGEESPRGGCRRHE